MKNVNLFPYRQQHKWHRTRIFQRAVAVTAVGSLLLAFVFSWALSQGLRMNTSGQSLKAEQQALIEEMYLHIQSTQALQEERSQRLVVLRVIREWAEHPQPGVWIKNLHWAEGVLQVDVWVSSNDQAQEWVERLQGIQGVVGIEKVAGTPDPVARELSMQVLQLKLKIGGGDVQP